MEIRPVETGDGDEILRWRNDEVARKMSLDSALVDAEQHKKWFTLLLDDPRRVGLVGLVHGRAVGWIRFDPLNSHNEYLVSISIAPELRSNGMGSQLLGLALQRLREISGKPVVYAKVKASNGSSLKIFQKHGFQKSEEVGLLHTLVLSS